MRVFFPLTRSLTLAPSPALGRGFYLRDGGSDVRVTLW